MPSQWNRFFSYVEASAEGNVATTCWNWTGKLDKDGYCLFYSSGQWMAAYRYSYRLFKGPIPSWLEIDHLCRNRLCVRVEHLEAVTHAENKRRAIREDRKRRKIDATLLGRPFRGSKGSGRRYL